MMVFILVEKRKSGEYLAAKVVSGHIFFHGQINSGRKISKSAKNQKTRCTDSFVVGKSGENVAAHNAVLGEQTDSQAPWQDVRALPALRGRRKDRGRQDVPRYGHGPAGQKFRRPVPGVQAQVRLENSAIYCIADGKRKAL